MVRGFGTISPTCLSFCPQNNYHALRCLYRIVLINSKSNLESKDEERERQRQIQRGWIISVAMNLHKRSQTITNENLNNRGGKGRTGPDHYTVPRLKILHHVCRSSRNKDPLVLVIHFQDGVFDLGTHRKARRTKTAWRERVCVVNPPPPLHEKATCPRRS